MIKNSIGRIIPQQIEGYKKVIPFSGAFNHIPQGRLAGKTIRSSDRNKRNKLVSSYKELFKLAGVKDGMSISFHHHLRNGDRVINEAVDALAQCGFKDLTLVPTALFGIHKELIKHINSGVITAIFGSVNGPIGRKVTEGVLSRAAQLADRESHELRDIRLPYTSIIPLKEVLSEIHGKGGASKFITREYFNILKKLGPELKILIDTPLSEIEEKEGSLIAEAVYRMRSKRVLIKEGFDGEYGRITLFNEKEIKSAQSKDQESLFAGEEPLWNRPEERKPIPFDLAEFNRLKQEENRSNQPKDIQKIEIKGEDPLKDLNQDQKRAAAWG